MDQKANYLKIWGLPEGTSEQEVIQKINLIGTVVKK